MRFATSPKTRRTHTAAKSVTTAKPATPARLATPVQPATPAKPATLPVSDLARERARLTRDREARRRFENQLIPGLPVDADAPQLRTRKMPRLGTLLQKIVTELTHVEEPFFDAVCDNFARLCPDFPATPGRYQDGRLFLYVRTSAQLFALRGKLPKVKRALLALPHAPRRLSVHLEIHS